MSYALVRVALRCFASLSGLIRFHLRFCRMQRLTCFAISFAAATPAIATLTVDPPRPLTHVVDVRLIQTAETDGSPVATALGNSSQRAGIEAAIDQIWAQAGIDIRMEPGLTRFNNTFALRGDGGNRPQGDLGQTVSLASNAGVLAPDSNTLNLFLVDVTPGFGVRPENSANGLAYINANGITSFVGESLLTYKDGRDLIGRVLAHEIGHNLGLRHTGSGTANLMSPGGTTQQLSATQISTALSSRFADTLPAGLPGDYNGDGMVDAADYSSWRDGLGGQYQRSDYLTWRSQYGSNLNASASGTFPLNGLPEPLLATEIPEPHTAILLLGLATICIPPKRAHFP